MRCPVILIMLVFCYSSLFGTVIDIDLLYCASLVVFEIVDVYLLVVVYERQVYNNNSLKMMIINL
jgi:hypothetical protein